jgi:hypothetical protein
MADLINAIPNLLRSPHAAGFRFSAVFVKQSDVFIRFTAFIGIGSYQKGFFPYRLQFFLFSKKNHSFTYSFITIYYWKRPMKRAGKSIE